MHTAMDSTPGDLFLPGQPMAASLLFPRVAQLTQGILGNSAMRAPISEALSSI
jgi:hypothetical protein